MKVSISKTLCLFLTTMLLAVLLTCIASAEGENHVVILATSDMHGNIWGYSYEDNAETDNNGMARLYTYIQQVREENPTVFLVDAGDVLYTGHAPLLCGRFGHVPYLYCPGSL